MIRPEYYPAYDALRIAALHCDSAGCIVFINEFARNLFDLSRTEALGRTITDALPPPDGQYSLDLTRLVDDATHIYEHRGRNATIRRISWTFQRLNGISEDDGGFLALGNVLPEALSCSLSDGPGPFRRTPSREARISGASHPAPRTSTHSRAEGPVAVVDRGACAPHSCIPEEARSIMQQACELLPYGTWICDAEGALLFVSLSFRELVGMTAEECSAFGWMDRLPPESRDKTLADWRRCIEQGATWDYEHRIRDKHGEYKSILSRGIPIRNGDSSIRWWVGINLDITERKIRENKLRNGHDLLEHKVAERTAELTFLNSRLAREIEERKHIAQELLTGERKFRALFENSLDALLLTSPSGDICGANPACCALFGRTEEELLGLRRMDIVADPNEPALLRLLDDRRRFGKARGTITYRRKDGSTFLGEVSGALLETGDGLERSILSIRDVTERAQAEERLRESEERFRKVFEQGPIGIALLNTDFRYIEANATYCRIVGYSSDELLNLTFIDITYPEDIDADANQARDLLAGKILSYEMEKRYVTKSGEIVWVNLCGSIIRDPQNKPLYFIAMIQDISERNAMTELLRAQAENLKRSNQDLEQFASITSHDLQEPLRNVVTCVQLLERKYEGQLDPDGSALIRYAVDSCKRMKELIDELLVYSRVAKGERRIEPVDADAVVKAALSNLASALDDPHVEISVEPLPMIGGNEALFTQVFQNIIGNALKFRKPDQPIKISIRAERNGDRWLFSVEDNGIGIDSEHLQTIFLVFKRLHTRQEYPGHGIGLATVKKIIERYGGHIWVESVPGMGSIFRFTLPAAPGDGGSTLNEAHGT